ncbi:MAG: RNA polymerase factor sigma-54 [Angelakisella sp.]
MKLEMNITQRQGLSQRMEQSVHILQMGAQELENYITELSMENPVIELEAGQEKDTQLYEELITNADKLEYEPRIPEAGLVFDGEENPLEKLCGETPSESLTDYLLRQLLYCSASPEDKLAAKRLIGYLDDNGYLTVDRNTLCSETGYNRLQLDTAITMIQSLDPPGVGAADLKECLCLQLAHDDLLARCIVTDFLSAMAQNRILHIADKLNVSAGEVAAAAERIRLLNPKPGAAYAVSAAPVYIKPDILVTVENGRCHLSLLQNAVYNLQISPMYMDILKQGTNKEASDYITRKLHQAQWVQSCIRSRNETLLKVAGAIVARQEQFFLSPNAPLQVFRLQDVAAQLGVHESTISRTVKDKYLRCSRGVFPLKTFFARGLGSGAQAHEGISTQSIKEQITLLIAAEDKKKPLSDQKICEELKKYNITLSRRAVAKYREELSIPNSSLRS